MLEVRCGVADRSHENRFFRYFASEVKNRFESLGFDGVLIGMPKCTVRENLQIDALLITDSAITIIDFKDYDGCTVTLPEESDFERGRWTTDSDIVVKGGSSPNPYTQLRLQRSRLREILEMFCRHKTAGFDPKHITSMVCFTGKISIKGSIPGRAKLTFSIADGESFLERLYDVVNVRSAGLLGSEFVKEMLSKLFEAPVYECELHPGKPAVMLVEEPVLKAEDTFVKKVKNFFASDDDVLIIRSTDYKKRLESAFVAREAAHDAGFIETKILSPTKLVGENLCDDIALDGSLYSEIYDFRAKYHDEDLGIDRVPVGTAPDRFFLSKDSDIPEAIDARLAFVVCEGQLITDSVWSNGKAIFGSGRLLSDLLEYLSIGAQNNGTNKLVVVGDDCQLGASSESSSCLYSDAYPSSLTVACTDLSPSQAEGDLESVCGQLADCIHKSDYSLFSLSGLSNGVSVIDTKEDERAAIEDAVRNWRAHKIITYTNAQANTLNLFIKRSILRNGERLASGDIVVFNEQFNAVASDSFADTEPTRLIRNGQFAQIRKVGEPIFSIPGQNDEGADAVTLVPVSFVLEGSREELETYVLFEYLYSDKAEISDGQAQAIRIKMAELEKKAYQQHPFCQGNPFYDEMIRADQFVSIEKEDGTVQYRDKSDRRKLTPQERRYREDVKRRLYSPGSLYFFLENTAKARFGWCLTAHKSRSYVWNEITLSSNAEMGRNSDGYFRYLYTGASRAKECLSVVRWEDVSPFEKTVFDADPSNARKRSKRKSLFRASSIENLGNEVKSVVIKVAPDLRPSHHASTKWREAYRFENAGREAIVAFDYNKDGEVLAPRLEKGDGAILLLLLERLENEGSEVSVDSPMMPIYEYLCSLEPGQIMITVNKSLPYQDEITVKWADASFCAVVYHGADKLVSRVELQYGSREAFGHFESLLRKNQTVEL